MLKKHRENLEKLANFLDRVVPPPKFDMTMYLSDSNNRWLNLDDAVKSTYMECGTSACAVGHGPLAGIRKLRTDGSWEGYCKRVFGIDSYHEDDWNWLFSDKWAMRDNTPEGAAARIRWYLMHGAPKLAIIIDQQRSHSPLCYADLIVKRIKEPAATYDFNTIQKE